MALAFSAQTGAFSYGQLAPGANGAKGWPMWIASQVDTHCPPEPEELPGGGHGAQRRLSPVDEQSTGVIQHVPGSSGPPQLSVGPSRWEQLAPPLQSLLMKHG